jgi:hypothetical protein
MEPTTYVQCPTCPLKRRNDRPQCKACHDAHIPLHPPGAPKKGPKPSAQQSPAVLPIPGAPKKGPKPATQPPPIPPIPVCIDEVNCADFRCKKIHPPEWIRPVKPCSYGVKCTQFGCTEPHPPERPEPVDPASKPCKFGITCGIFGCKKQHPEGHVAPADPVTKPCPCEAKFGFCCVKRNPTCLHPHKVSRVKKP